MIGRISPFSFKKETNHKCHEIWAIIWAIHYMFPTWKL